MPNFACPIRPEVHSLTASTGGSFNTIAFGGTSINTVIYNTEESEAVDVYLNDLEDAFTLAGGADITITSHIETITFSPAATGPVDVTVIGSVVA